MFGAKRRTRQICAYPLFTFLSLDNHLDDPVKNCVTLSISMISISPQSYPRLPFIKGYDGATGVINLFLFTFIRSHVTGFYYRITEDTFERIYTNMQEFYASKKHDLSC
jgi:hypothetical protein